MDKDLLSFLKAQKLLVLATKDSSPWVSNVYYSINDDGRIYFISNKDTLHGKHLLKDDEVAFSVAWYDPNNHLDRKAAQGKGHCRVAKTDEEIKEGVHLHNVNFPEFKSRITFKWAKMMGYRVWYIDPTYIKFWNDQLFGIDGSREYYLK